MGKAPVLGRKYTYADLKSWPDDERWELIGGVPYAMSPSPVPYHQFIVGTLYRKLAQLLEGQPCQPVVAPFDVAFGVPNAKKDDADTVVQPDIVVLCKDSEMPKIVVEVLSASTAMHDLNTKKAAYLAAGIPEYWAVSFERGMITRFSLEGGVYVTYNVDEGEFASLILPEAVFDVKELFAQAVASLEAVGLKP